MQPPPQTRTDIVNATSESPGCFDLLAALMSLVVKLLLSFNIVYRQWHLSAVTVIYPFLGYTVFPLNTICACSPAAGHACQIFDPPIHQPILEIRPFFMYPMVIYDQSHKDECLWPQQDLDYLCTACGMGRTLGVRKLLPSPTFPLGILIRLLIYLFL